MPARSGRKSKAKHLRLGGKCQFSLFTSEIGIPSPAACPQRVAQQRTDFWGGVGRVRVRLGWSGSGVN